MQIYYLGGSPCCGKSSIAEKQAFKQAKEHGYSTLLVDELQSIETNTNFNLVENIFNLKK